MAQFWKVITINWGNTSNQKWRLELRNHSCINTNLMNTKVWHMSATTARCFNDLSWPMQMHLSLPLSPHTHMFSFYLGGQTIHSLMFLWSYKGSDCPDQKIIQAELERQWCTKLAWSLPSPHYLLPACYGNVIHLPCAQGWHINHSDSWEDKDIHGFLDSVIYENWK